jgi:hypothetical protein
MIARHLSNPQLYRRLSSLRSLDRQPWTVVKRKRRLESLRYNSELLAWPGRK